MNNNNYYSQCKYLDLSSLAISIYPTLSTASIMADHVGGGSMPLSHTFNISRRQSCGFSLCADLIISSVPDLIPSISPMVSHLLQTGP